MNPEATRAEVVTALEMTLDRVLLSSREKRTLEALRAFTLSAPVDDLVRLATYLPASNPR